MLQTHKLNNKNRKTKKSKDWLDWHLQESILPNFDFFVFLVFTIKLAISKYRQYFLMLQTLKLNIKIRKKSTFYEEKSLVGLTPGKFFSFLSQKKAICIFKLSTHFPYICSCWSLWLDCCLISFSPRGFTSSAIFFSHKINVFVSKKNCAYYCETLINGSKTILTT